MPLPRVILLLKLPKPLPKSLLPRQRPVPKPKPETRWERFAKEKGIEKKKRGRMVWDEAHKDWRPRWGYGRANDETKDWIIEHKGDGPGDGGDEDVRSAPTTALVELRRS